MLLIAGQARGEALVAIRDIAQGVAGNVFPGKDERGDRPARERRPTNALAGLFHAHADMAEIIPDGMETCGEVVERCLDRATQSSVFGLYGGWAGLGWVTSHLDSDDDFVGAHADRVLVDALKDWPPRRGYDLISGLVGVGVYLVDRLPRASAVRGLAQILEILERTAVDTDDGTTWFTAPEFLPAWQRERAPNGYYNLGVAHGTPGICWLLAALYGAGIEANRAETLLRGNLRWLSSQQADPTRPELPSWIAPGVEPAPSGRMAWCYGPLGASAVALQAATAIGDQQSADWARTLALACAGVPPAEARIQDAGLCHGAAGNLQIFRRLHENTGEPQFREAALAWFDATLAYRRPGEGVGGYRMWGEVEDGRQGWLDDSSFLAGSGGVGLALLGAVTDVESKWDRLLLLS